MTNRPAIIAFSAAALCLGLAGCSGGGGLTTGSLFGGDDKAKAAAPVVRNDPVARALQVGSASARAVKCGYNFNATGLRANYFAYEAQNGLAITELSKLEKVYDTAYRGVTKAVKAQPDYCTSAKTTLIKADLTRHLAGDYAPSQRKIKDDDENCEGKGLFCGGIELF